MIARPWKYVSLSLQCKHKERSTLTIKYQFIAFVYSERMMIFM